MSARWEILEGDCLAGMARMDAESVQCVVTSPPYWGLRDYNVKGQFGLEKSPEAYVENLRRAFREVHRVLKKDGVVWLNLGDSYANSRQGGFARGNSRTLGPLRNGLPGNSTWRINRPSTSRPAGFKSKDLVGIPWMVAFALRADGWFLRQDIIWHKPNPMPESVTDRCTKAHEYLFLLAKSERYFFDHVAVKENSVDPTNWRLRCKSKFTGRPGLIMPDGKAQAVAVVGKRNVPRGATRNRRSVWTITTRPYKGAHFATFPPQLAEVCIRAGSRPGDLVMDPFGGAGTVCLVATQLGRRSVMTELNPEYCAMARARISAAAAEGTR